MTWQIRRKTARGRGHRLGAMALAQKVMPGHRGGRPWPEMCSDEVSDGSGHLLWMLERLHMTAPFISRTSRLGPPFCMLLVGAQDPEAGSPSLCQPYLPSNVI